MNATVREISTLALELPTRSRALLAGLLLDSLDDGPVEDNERAWVETVRRRDREMTEGRVSGREHSAVMRAARESLQ